MKFIPKITNRQLWVISCVLFTAGIILPMFSFRSFFIFNDTFSLLGGILHLLKEGEVLLFVLVFSFSILGPVYKLYLCHVLIGKKIIDTKSKLIMVKKLAIISKWSMADVFVVAIIAATIKLGMIASVKIHIGLAVFSLAVLSSMWLVQRQMLGYELKPVNEES